MFYSLLLQLFSLFKAIESLIIVTVIFWALVFLRRSAMTTVLDIIVLVAICSDFVCDIDIYYTPQLLFLVGLRLSYMIRSVFHSNFMIIIYISESNPHKSFCKISIWSVLFKVFFLLKLKFFYKVFYFKSFV